MKTLNKIQPIKLGDLFVDRKEIYTLVQVGPAMVCAVGRNSHNRFREPIKVKKVFDITPAELKKIMGESVREFLWERANTK